MAKCKYLLRVTNPKSGKVTDHEFMRYRGARLRLEDAVRDNADAILFVAIATYEKGYRITGD